LFQKIPSKLEDLVVVDNTKTLSFIEPILPMENCTDYCRSKTWCVFNDGCKFITDRELLNTLKDSALASKNYDYQFTDERGILLNIDETVFHASGEMDGVFVDPKRVLDPGVIHGDHPEVTNKKEVLYGEPYHQKSLGMFENAFSKGSLMNAYQGSSSSFFGYPMNGINVRSTNQDTETITETFRNSFLETMTCGKHQHIPVIDPGVYKKWDKFQIRDRISGMNINCLDHTIKSGDFQFDGCFFGHNNTHSYYKMTDYALSSTHDGYSVNAYEFFYGDYIGSLSHYILEIGGDFGCDSTKASQLWRLVPESNSPCNTNWGYNGEFFSPNGQNTGRDILGLDSAPISNVEFGSNNLEHVDIVIDVLDEDDPEAVKAIYSYNGTEKVYLFCNQNECEWRSNKDQVFVHEQHFASDTKSKLPQQKIHPTQTVAVYEIIGGFWEKVGYLANKGGNLKIVRDINDMDARGWRNLLQNYPSKKLISNSVTNQFKEEWGKKVEFNTDTLVASFKVIDENVALIFMDNGAVFRVDIQSGSKTQLSPPLITQSVLNKLEVLDQNENRTLFTTLEYDNFYFVNHVTGAIYNFTHPDAVPNDPTYFPPQALLDDSDGVIIYTYRNVDENSGKISKITVTENNIISEQVITTEPLKKFKVEIENGRILYFEKDGDKGFSKVNYWDGTAKHEDITRIYSLAKNVDKRFNDIELLYTDMSGESPKFITNYRSFVLNEQDVMSFPGPVQIISFDGVRTKNATDLGETITGVHFDSFEDYFVINTFGVTKGSTTVHLEGLSTFDSGSLKLINAQSYGFDEGYIFKGNKVLFVGKDGKSFEIDSIPEPEVIQGENHYFDTKYAVYGNKLFTLVNYKERILFPDATISIYDSELTSDFPTNGQVQLKDVTVELHKDDTLANHNVFIETVTDIPTESDTFKWVDNDCPEDFYVHRISMGKSMDDFKVGCFKSPGCTLSGTVGLVETDKFQFVECKHGSVMVGFNKTHIKCQEIVIEDSSPANLPVYHKAGTISKSESGHDSSAKRPPDGIQNWVGRPMQKFSIDESNEKVLNHYYGTECEVSLADARLFNLDNYLIVENKDLDNGEICKLKNAYVTFLECRDKDCRRGFNVTCTQAKGCGMRGEDRWYEEMCPAGQVIIGVACVGEDENRPCSKPMFRCREVFDDPSFLPDRPSGPTNNDPSIGEIARYIIYSLLSIMVLTGIAVLCLCCGSSTDIGSGQERLSSVDPSSRIYNF
jgi:hypothetical protein